MKFQLWFFLHPINAITSVNDPYLAIGGDFYSFFMTSLVKYSDAKNLDVVLTHQLDDISTRFGLGLPNPPFFFFKGPTHKATSARSGTRTRGTWAAWIGFLIPHFPERCHISVATSHNISHLHAELPLPNPSVSTTGDCLQS